MPFPFLQSSLALLATSILSALSLGTEITEICISSKENGDIVVG